MQHFLALVVLTLIAFVSPQAKAEQNIGYYGFEPDIIANYISQRGDKLGYVKVTVDLMLNDVNDLEVVEHHMPLLHDAIVEIFSQEPESRVKSITGREEIRQKCIEKIQSLLVEETGKELIRDVLFTKYLYH